MKNFDFFFGVVLGILILSHTDNLSKTLQHKEFSASEGQEVAELTVKTLESIRNEESFDAFWEKLEKDKELLEVNDPIVPRKRKVPKRLEIGAGTVDYMPPTSKSLYRQQYYEALDLIINCVRSRFKQPGYNTYKNLQELLFKAIKGEDFQPELEFISQLYRDDINSANLKVQLQILACDYPKQKYTTIFDIRDYIRNLTPAKKQLMAEICTVLKLVMPASNATSEWSFSALRHVKTYLRSKGGGTGEARGAIAPPLFTDHFKNDILLDYSDTENCY